MWPRHRGRECSAWFGLLTPARTPPPIVAQLTAALNAALADKVIYQRLQEIGVDPSPNTSPEDMAALLKTDLDKWGPIIKAAGIQLE